MHVEQSRFLLALSEVFPRHFHGASVLEIGSYDVNGSIRPLFIQPKRYVGVDLVEGPCVDVVIPGEELCEDYLYDTVVSTECFEHAPKFLDIFENMASHTRSGGLVAFTCATEGRHEHGTSRTTPQNSPGTVKTGSEYYRNVRHEDFSLGFLYAAFSSCAFFVNDYSHDLYFVGVARDAPVVPEQVFNLIAQRCGARRL